MNNNYMAADAASTETAHRLELAADSEIEQRKSAVINALKIAADVHTLITDFFTFLTTDAASSASERPYAFSVFADRLLTIEQTASQQKIMLETRQNLIEVMDGGRFQEELGALYEAYGEFRNALLEGLQEDDMEAVRTGMERWRENNSAFMALAARQLHKWQESVSG